MNANLCSACFFTSAHVALSHLKVEKLEAFIPFKFLDLRSDVEIQQPHVGSVRENVACLI